MKQRPLTTKPKTSQRVDPQTIMKACEMLSSRSKKQLEENQRAKSGGMATSKDLTRASSNFTGTQLNLNNSSGILTVPQHPGSAMSHQSVFKNYKFAEKPTINVTMFPSNDPTPKPTINSNRPSGLLIPPSQFKLPYEPTSPEQRPTHQRRITEECAEFNDSVSECSNEQGSSVNTTKQSARQFFNFVPANNLSQAVTRDESWPQQIESKMRDLGQKINIYLSGSFSPTNSSAFSPLNSTENLRSEPLSVRQSPTRGLIKIFELKEPDRYKPETQRVQQIPIEFERFKRQQRIKKLHMLARGKKVNKIFNKDPSHKVLLSFDDNPAKSPVVRGRSSMFSISKRNSSRRRLLETSNSNFDNTSISSQTYEESQSKSPVLRNKRESSLTKSSDADRSSPRSFLKLRQKSSFNLRASLINTSQPRSKVQGRQKPHLPRTKLKRQDFMLACQTLYLETMEVSVTRAKEIFVKNHTKETISILKKLASLASLALDLPLLLSLYLVIIETLFLRDRFVDCLMYCQHYLVVQERNRYTKQPHQIASCLKFKAKCEMQISDYGSALNTLNFLLELSMRHEFTALEIQAYGWMALCHYYLSDLENCTYFLTRQMRGIVEPKGSELQQIYNLLRLNYGKSQQNGGNNRLGWEEDLFDQFFQKLQSVLANGTQKFPFDQTKQGFSHAASFEKDPFVQPMLFQLRSIINFRYFLHDSVDAIFRHKNPQKIFSEQGSQEFRILEQSLKQNRYPQSPEDGTIMLIDSLGNYNNFNPMKIKVPECKPDQNLTTSLQELKLPHPKMLRIDQYMETARKSVERKSYYDPVLRDLLPTLYRGRHEAQGVPKQRADSDSLDFETYLQDLQRRAKNRSSKRQNAPIYLSHINRPIRKKFKSEQERNLFLTKHFTDFIEIVKKRTQKLQKPTYETEREFITETDGFQALVLGLEHLQSAIENSPSVSKIEVKRQPSMKKVAGILKSGKSFCARARKEKSEQQQQRFFICDKSPANQKQEKLASMAQLGMIPVENESVNSPTLSRANSIANSNVERALKRKQTLLKLEEEEQRNKEELDRRDEIFSAGLSRRGSIGISLIRQQSEMSYDRRKSVQMNLAANPRAEKLTRLQSQRQITFEGK